MAGEERDAAPPTLDMLFLELASPHRLRFLAELRARPRGASHLAKLSGVSVQEGMRHLGRLQDLRLVQRRSDREYVLTPLGESICATFPWCASLLEHADFVLDHGLSWLPKHLSPTPLLTAPRVRATESENILAQEQAIEQAGRFLWRASDQLFWHLPQRMPPSPPEGREWRAVYTPDVVRQERFLELPRAAASVRGAQAPGRWRIVLVRELPVMLTVTDRDTLLFLRGAQGGVDFRERVHGQDATLRSWARALFRHLDGTGVVAFDTAHGHRFDEWGDRMLDATKRLADAPR
jgi:predicted transcriptional regulator